MDAVLFACQLLVGAILLMSAVLKLVDVPDFVATVRKYAIAPGGTAPLVAGGVIAAEAFAGLTLLSGEAAIAGAAVAALLFAVFIVAVTINIRRGANLDCGCFGLLWREQTGWPTVTRDALLLGAALAVAIGGPGVVLRDAASDGDGFIDYLSLVLAGLVVLAAGTTVVAAVRIRREEKRIQAEAAQPPAGGLSVRVPEGPGVPGARGEGV